MNMPRTVNRIAPLMRPDKYKTYQMVMPKATHTRSATCQEVECANYAFGWMVVLDENIPIQAEMANDIRLRLGRKYVVSQLNNIITFTFPGGQPCFADHRVPLERPELFIVKRGYADPVNESYADPRRGTTMRAEDWVDDCQNNQDKLNTLIERG